MRCFTTVKGMVSIVLDNTYFWEFFQMLPNYPYLWTLQSWLLIFTFCSEYFQAHSATVLVVTTMNIFLMFLRVLLAGQFSSQSSHHYFQILISYLSFCKISDELAKSFFPSCILFCVVLELSLTWNSVELNKYWTYTLCFYCVKALI